MSCVCQDIVAAHPVGDNDHQGFGRRSGEGGGSPSVRSRQTRNEVLGSGDISRKGLPEATVMERGRSKLKGTLGSHYS